VPVIPGTKYAIVVCSPIANMFRWSYENGETYSGGAAFIWFGSSWFPGGSSVKDFDFKAWVSGNSAPTVAPDSPSVSVPEGTAPTQTGTYSDVDGDTVSITASAGTVKQTGTSSGTWSWTQAASDEAPTQTVFITADDGHGLTNQASFMIDVFAVAPTALILTDPVSVPEGTTVPFTGGATSPYPAETFTYAWTVKTSDGATFATGSGSAFSFTPSDEGAYAVTLTATDDGRMSNTTSPVTVTETDITPTAKIDSILPSDPNLRSPLIIAPGESLNFSGSFSDAAIQDTHTESWSFGDGSPAAGGLATTHSYALAGTYTVALTVKDDDGVSGSTTTTVQVLTPQQVLTRMETYIGGLSGLNAGEKNSLIAKLNAASDAAARGDNRAASNQLNAFLNELQADYNTNKISPAAYGALRADAYAIKGALGTYNRFLEWWPLEA
jgi:PKD domain-containing protein/FIMAH domain-containing protein/Big-like domain-containing protein